ncbi:MAG: hypothetical protein FJZ57_02880, partial [Chlamydiae bacterium]|nr:hypothetical protein [Chlamydiota bacterium]
MRRFQVLDRNTRVFGRFFLEASAGTGKTFAIEHIVVRTILESDTPLSIDQILIVTFTRAATRELKVRIRNNLTKTLLFLQKGVSGPDYLLPIFEKGSEVVFSAQRKIEEALCNFDKANVFTLHGFCHKILSEFAFEAGEFFEINSPESKSHSLKILQVVEDYFRAGIDQNQFSTAQIDLLITSKPKEFGKVVKKIAKWIEKDVIIEDYLSWHQILDLFNQNLKNISEQYLLSKECFESDINLLFPLFKRIKDTHKDQALAFFEILQASQISEEEFRSIISSKDYFLSLILDNNLKKGKNVSNVKLFYKGLRDICIEKLLPLIEEARDKEVIFLRIVKECLTSWKKSSLYQESFSPDDLLRKMVGALKREDLRQKIAEKFAVGVIDEFQDTDPMQWEIFKSLFLADESLLKTIYLVGDPKQSIYSFRNADVYTYIKAMKDVGEDNRLFLDTNFRSEPSLVNALNTLFTQDISKGWMSLPSTGQSLEVIAVNSKGEISIPADVKPVSDLHFFLCEGHTGRSKQWPNEKLEEGSLFPYILSEVRRMVQNEDVKYGKIAILVRDRYQASRLEEYFKRFQVPCSVKRSLTIQNSVAYAALHDVICAVTRPDDISAIKRVLAGIFIGAQANEIMLNAESRMLQKAKYFFQTEHSKISHKGWGAFFQTFFSHVWNEGGLSTLEGILTREEKSLYFEIRQIIQVAMQSCPNIYSLDSFYEFCCRLALLDSEDEILKVHLESEEDQVVIMTIHTSKGLEFDIVFALGLISRVNAKDDIIKTKDNGEETLEKWDLSKESCIRTILESDAEKMRHLYVALTRAKKRLYVPIAIDLDQKEVELSRASSIELLCQSFGKKEFDILNAYNHLHLMTTEQVIEHINKLSKNACIGYTIVDDRYKESLQYSFKHEGKDLQFRKAANIVFSEEKDNF